MAHPLSSLTAESYIYTLLSSSFVTHFNQKFGSADLENYMRTHITEPPCLTSNVLKFG